MRRRPQEQHKQAIIKDKISTSGVHIGLVLSGGGSRAAYQVGALRALLAHLEGEDPISVLIGSSIGAVNSIIIGACLKNGIRTAIDELDLMWRERTFANTFAGSPSTAFFRAIKMAAVQYLAPGPNATENAIFDPTPLRERVDEVIKRHGGLRPENRLSSLEAVAVMTAVEGQSRKPLLFLSAKKRMDQQTMSGASFEVAYVEDLTAKHGLASAALPSVLPPVELNMEDGTVVRLVDGGIAQNVPVDPAVRLGAEKVIVVDVSGRDWWLNRYGEAHDKRPDWEIPAEFKTFCVRPPLTFVSRCQKPLGPLLKETVAKSTKKFIQALGATWPVYTLLKSKMGEEVALEAMTYVALHPDYTSALIERGYNETMSLLRTKEKMEFVRVEDYDKWMESL